MRILQSVLLLAVFFVNVTQAKADPLALGVIIGTQTGFSFKYNMSERRAIDGAISYSSDNDFGTAIHADYLFDRARVFSADRSGPIDFYYGLGLRASNIRRGSDDGKTLIGVRAPFGLQYSIVNPNLDFFGELVPVLEVTPRSDVVVDAGIGLRYRF